MCSVFMARLWPSSVFFFLEEDTLEHDMEWPDGSRDRSSPEPELEPQPLAEEASFSPTEKLLLPEEACAAAEGSAAAACIQLEPEQQPHCRESGSGAAESWSC